MSTLTSSILNALSAAGIDATEIDLIKNGVSCTGFRINNGSNISPVIYYSPNENIEMFVERVLQIIEQPSPAFNIESLISKESLLTSTLLSVQRKSSEDLVKWDSLRPRIDRTNMYRRSRARKQRVNKIDSSNTLSVRS